MVKIIGVRFRNAGKVYYFDPGEDSPKRGSKVIVETSRGTECGRVVLPPKEVDESEIVQPLRSIVRVADEKDLEREKENFEKEKEAFRTCREMILNHGLDMKLVKAEYTFDGRKILFYFTADERVDFRELVKDLASVFKTRIELRQIGVRDETKLLGGMGICGRPLCCASYLTDFVPVSIKMAKEQNLSLNPAKISGVCGRLMCCLKNEEEAYEYLNKNLPGNGDIMRTPEGKEGHVQAVNVLKQTVRVLIDQNGDKEIEEYPADELTMLAKRRKGGIYQWLEKSESSSGETNAEKHEDGSTAAGKNESEEDRRERRRERRGRQAAESERHAAPERKKKPVRTGDPVRTDNDSHDSAAGDSAESGQNERRRRRRRRRSGRPDPENHTKRQDTDGQRTDNPS